MVVGRMIMGESGLVTGEPRILHFGQSMVES